MAIQVNIQTAAAKAGAAEIKTALRGVADEVRNLQKLLSGLNQSFQQLASAKVAFSQITASLKATTAAQGAASSAQSKYNAEVRALSQTVTSGVSAVTKLQRGLASQHEELRKGSQAHANYLRSQGGVSKAYADAASAYDRLNRARAGKAITSGEYDTEKTNVRNSLNERVKAIREEERVRAKAAANQAQQEIREKQFLSATNSALSQRSRALVGGLTSDDSVTRKAAQDYKNILNKEPGFQGKSDVLTADQTVKLANAYKTGLIPSFREATAAHAAMTKQFSVDALTKAAGGAATFRDRISELNKAIVVALGPLSGIGSRLLAFSHLASESTIVLAGLVVGLIGYAVALKKTVVAGAEVQENQLQLQGMLKATGNQVGYTAGQVEAFSVNFAQAMGVPVNSAREAANEMLIFGNVTGENFKKALVVAQNLASVGIGGLTGNIRILGRALNDPVQNLGALGRAIGTLTIAQKEQLKVLFDSGQQYKADEYLLGKLLDRTAGSGVARGSGLSGTFERIKNDIQIFFETAAKGGGVTEELQKDLEALHQRFSEITGGFAGAANAGKGFRDVIVVVNALTKVLIGNLDLLSGALLGYLGGRALSFVISKVGVLTSGVLTLVGAFRALATVGLTGAGGALEALGLSAGALVPEVGAAIAIIGALGGALYFLSRRSSDTSDTTKALNDRLEKLKLSSVDQGVSNGDRERLALAKDYEKQLADINDQLEKQRARDRANIQEYGRPGAKTFATKALEDERASLLTQKDQLEQLNPLAFGKQLNPEQRQSSIESLTQKLQIQPKVLEEQKEGLETLSQSYQHAQQDAEGFGLSVDKYTKLLDESYTILEELDTRDPFRKTRDSLIDEVKKSQSVVAATKAVGAARSEARIQQEIYNKVIETGIAHSQEEARLLVAVSHTKPSAEGALLGVPSAARDPRIADIERGVREKALIDLQNLHEEALRSGSDEIRLNQVRLRGLSQNAEQARTLLIINQKNIELQNRGVPITGPEAEAERQKALAVGQSDFTLKLKDSAIALDDEIRKLRLSTDALKVYGAARTQARIETEKLTQATRDHLFGSLEEAQRRTAGGRNPFAPGSDESRRFVQEGIQAQQKVFEDLNAEHVKAINTGREELLVLQAEFATTSLTRDAREQYLEGLRTSLDLLNRGVDLSDAQAKEELKVTEQLHEQRSALQDFQKGIEEISNFSGSAFDKLGEGLTKQLDRARGEKSHFRDTFRSIGEEAQKEFFKLSATNPIKNFLFNKDDPTLKTVFDALTGSGRPKIEDVNKTLATFTSANTQATIDNTNALNNLTAKSGGSTGTGGFPANMVQNGVGGPALSVTTQADQIRAASGLTGNSTFSGGIGSAVGTAIGDAFSKAGGVRSGTGTSTLGSLGSLAASSILGSPATGSSPLANFFSSHFTGGGGATGSLGNLTSLFSFLPSGGGADLGSLFSNLLGTTTTALPSGVAGPSLPGGAGTGLLGSLSGLFSAGGFFGSGGTAAGGLSSLTGLFSAGGFFGSGGAAASGIGSLLSYLSLLFVANGMAFQNGSPMNYAKGDVFSQPTRFAMTGGRMGMLGEAGPEGVLPLARNASGQLGVMSHGGGGRSGGPPQITVIDNVGANVTARNRTSASGEDAMEIMIDQATARGIRRGSEVSKALRDVTGASVKPIKRG